MLKEAPITYTVPLKKVVDFALHGTAKGPSDILRKKRIKELLGLRVMPRSNVVPITGPETLEFAVVSEVVAVVLSILGNNERNGNCCIFNAAIRCVTVR